MTATTTTAEDEKEVAGYQHPTQPHLSRQDATTVDAAKLTALTPEVVRK